MSASLISTGLSRNNLERFWPLWLCFAAAWLLGLILPLAVIVPALGNAAQPLMAGGWHAEYIASLVGCAIASVVTVNFVFEYLFSQQSAVFHGSLPIKRSSLFLSTYLSGLLPLIAIEIIVALVLMILAGVYPAIEAVSVWTWLVLTLGFTFVFYTLASFCAVLTGVRALATSLFVLVNFFVLFVEGFMRVISSVTMWGVSMFDTFSTIWTSPLVGLGYYCISNGGLTASGGVNFVSLIAYCLVAVVLLIATLLLNNRRNLERAGATTAFSWVRLICKYVVGVAAAVFFGFVVLLIVEISGIEGVDGVINAGQIGLITIFMILGGFLGLFFAEVALSKSARVAKKCWKGSVALAVLSVAFMAGCSMDVFHVANYVPKASEVKSVELDNTVVLQEEDSVQLAITAHQQILNYGWHPYSADASSASFYIKYTLKNGAVVTRNYTLYQINNADEHAALNPEFEKVVHGIDAALNCEEGLDSKFKNFIDKPVGTVHVTLYHFASDEDEAQETYLNASDVQEFVSGPLMKDVRENGLGRTEFGVSSNSAASHGESTGYSMDLQCFSNDAETAFYSVELTKSNCPNVAKWLKEHYKVDVL